MDKFKITLKDVLILCAIIVIDIMVFIILGLLLMTYDDFYDESKGEYWSLASMNSKEKIIYIAYNLWIFLNIIGIVFLGIKTYKRIKYGT